MTLPTTRLGISAFRLFGSVGLLAAIAMAMGVSAGRDLSLALEGAIIVAACATFLALAALSKRLIYYHHEIAVLALTAAIAAVAGAPVIDHLDATALGLGAFLAFGRIGCLHAGCCHGRVARRGIVYDRSVPGYLAGLPLVPVPAIEAAGVALLVIAGAASGSGFAVYVGGYALLRFPLELVRGDPGRRWWRGLSEAQWTSLLVAAALVAIDPDLRHAIPLAILVPAAALQAAFGRPRGALDPRHVRELAAAMDEAESRDGVAPPSPVTTSLGVRVSHGSHGACDHWSLSGTAPATGRALARVVTWLRAPAGEAEVVTGTAGLLHVIVPR